MPNPPKLVDRVGKAKWSEQGLTTARECAAACAQRAAAFACTTTHVDARCALSALRAEATEMWRADQRLRSGLLRSYAENDRLRLANAELLRGLNAAKQHSILQARRLNEAEGKLGSTLGRVEWGIRT